MSNQPAGNQPVPPTKGVTVQALATVDLGPEIVGMAAASSACVS